MNRGPQEVVEAVHLGVEQSRSEGSIHASKGQNDDRTDQSAADAPPGPRVRVEHADVNVAGDDSGNTHDGRKFVHAYAPAVTTRRRDIVGVDQQEIDDGRLVDTVEHVNGEAGNAKELARADSVVQLGDLNERTVRDVLVKDANDDDGDWPGQ